MPCTELILNPAIGEKLLFFSHDPILATLESALPLDTSAMWVKIYVRTVDNVNLNFSSFAQSKAGFSYVTELHQNYRGVNDFKFDLSSVLRGYVQNNKPNTGYLGTGGSMVAFFFKYGRYNAANVKQAEQGESNVMYVARRASQKLFDYVDTEDYIFKTSVLTYKKFLSYNTNIQDADAIIYQLPAPKKLTRTQKDFLYFIVQADDCAPTTSNNYRIYISYYLLNGTPHEASKQVSLNSGVKYMHVGIQEIITFFEIPFSAEQIANYRVDVVQDDTSELSESRTYKLVEDNCLETFTILFENRLGGYETILCRGVNEIGLDRDYSEYSRSYNYNFTSADALTKMRLASLTDVKLLRTGWLKIEEFEWLQDLACSVNIFILHNDLTATPIKLKQANWNRKTTDQLYSLTLDISHSNMQNSLTN